MSLHQMDREFIIIKYRGYTEVTGFKPLEKFQGTSMDVVSCFFISKRFGKLTLMTLRLCQSTTIKRATSFTSSLYNTVRHINDKWPVH